MKPIAATMILAAALIGLGAAAPRASAGVLVSGLIKQQRLCATVTYNKLYTNNCNGGDAQNWFTMAYGQQKYHGLCLDSETAAGGSQLVVVACQNKPSQRWSLYTDGSFHNESGWCMDVSGGNVNEGAKIETWKCNGLRHQVWGNGTFVPASQVPALLKAHPPLPGTVVSSLTAKLISSDSAGLIRAGGGATVIAAGGGNVIAAGGGNLIILQGGAVVGPAAGS